MAFALWCSITFVQFRGDELLLYPLAGYFAWAVWRDQTKIVPLLARSWIVMVFPVWCLISPLWAVQSTGALKHALYLNLTIMICYQVAATMSPRRIMHAVLVAAGIIGLINFLYAFASGDIYTGIFPQKNFMGKYMVVLWVIGIAVVFDKKSSRWIRLAAAGLACIAALMGFLSGSATAMLLIIGTGFVVLFGVMLFLGGVMRASRLGAICLFLSAFMLGGALVLPSLQTNVAEAILGAFGKDATLTGRTVLWDYAEEQIRERPVLGVGAGGFWNYNSSPLVQKIYEEFHKSPGDYFNFHNSYYEIAVHQGLIGLGMAVLALIWATYHLLRGAFRIGDLPQIYFMAHAIPVILRTTTEADFLRPFTLFHMILWIGALSAVRTLDRRRTAKRQVQSNAAQQPRLGAAGY